MAAPQTMMDLIRSKVLNIANLGIKEPTRDLKRFRLQERVERCRIHFAEQFDKLPGQHGTTSDYGVVTTGLAAKNVERAISLNPNWVVNGDNTIPVGCPAFTDGGIRISTAASANAKTWLMPLFASPTATPDFVNQANRNISGTDVQDGLISSAIAAQVWDYDRNPYFRAMVRFPSAADAQSIGLFMGFRNIVNTTTQAAALGASGSPLTTTIAAAVSAGEEQCGFWAASNASAQLTSGWNARQGQGGTTETIHTGFTYGLGTGATPTIQPGVVYDFEIVFDGGIGSRYPRFFVNGLEFFPATKLRQRARSAWTANNILIPQIAFGGNGKNLDILRVEVGQSILDPTSFVSGVTATGAGLLSD